MTVYLVGAGPGDPGLITVRGAELIRTAEVIVHDRLANPELVSWAPADAEVIDAGKEPGRARLTQDQINTILVERGATGRRVVRLKGGDPFVFGRGGEEAAALTAAGVPFEVVPGITSALAAPVYAGIPTTLRPHSLSITIVAGHEETAGGETVDWAAVAALGGTIAILMAAARAAVIGRSLIEAGLPVDTPTAWVHWGTYPHQSVWRGRLADLGAAEVPSPSVIVVGSVAALDMAWFDRTGG